MAIPSGILQIQPHKGYFITSFSGLFLLEQERQQLRRLWDGGKSGWVHNTSLNDCDWFKHQHAAQVHLILGTGDSFLCYPPAMAFPRSAGWIGEETVEDSTGERSDAVGNFYWSCMYLTDWILWVEAMYSSLIAEDSAIIQGIHITRAVGIWHLLVPLLSATIDGRLHFCVLHWDPK